MFDKQQVIMNKKSSPANGTRERILQAGGEVFAESGFERATIREICRRASVNIAAINYHFQDKENLYLQVLQYCKALAFKKYPSYLHTRKKDPPEVKLKAFVRSFLFRVLDRGSSSLFGRMVSREYIEPTRALDVLVEETIRPVFSQLGSIIAEILGKGAQEMRIRLCCASVVGQCLFYLYAGHVLKKLFPDQKFETREIETIAEHIVRFSLSAIEDFHERKKGEEG